MATQDSQSSLTVRPAINSPAATLRLSNTGNPWLEFTVRWVLNVHFAIAPNQTRQRLRLITTHMQMETKKALASFMVIRSALTSRTVLSATALVTKKGK